MRADRLISILLLLQHKGKLTTRELAKELEVTERTIHRDMDALSAAGIPVVAERGKAGGWRLLKQYRTNLTGLKANEIESLLISPSFQLLTDLGLTKDWHEARQKILASIPSSFQKNADDLWNRIHIDTSAWKQSTEKMESFKVLQQALREDRKLQLNYERADGKCVERVVNPLGLVAKGSTWYLIAGSNEQIRNYRVSRVKSALLMSETFIRPEEFNLAQYWDSSTQEFIQNLPKYEVDVEVSPSILPRIKFTGRFVQILKIESPTESGWTPIKLRFDTEQEAKEYILGFSNQIKIVRPDTLKQDIYDMARAVLDFYDQENQL
ncbi:helix-turn-helix transcriptional regulator [Pseudobacillus badius]|uniref:helix-turn-helix transcriptional regulator n=1 Tax=Bacillus badius TaxID=1455 RepID=UPI0007B04F02|nr:YafY family protein [Bacillus badius]KZN98434.1 transcriptional regulator [Bacillus badius]OCS83135.1 transcriptional regulator [Bacillus badius]OVE51510.1 transcriptional regulator [Bacillus badius]TDW02747.1 putative DNA-binding transcriptional regulator YafY [Bacillus badius]